MNVTNVDLAALFVNPYLVWYKRPFVVIDVETTGTSTRNDRVVQIAVARFHEKEQPVATFSSLVYPGQEIPREATAIHGIGTHDVAAAPFFHEVYARLLHCDILQNAMPAAYNESFDRALINAEISRMGVDLPYSPPPALDNTVRWIDPLTWARDTAEHGAKNKLVNVCERYGVSLVDAHSALGDAIAAGQVLLRMREETGDCTFTELIRRQDILRAEQVKKSPWLGRT